MDGVVMFVKDETNVFAVETDNGFTVFESVETDYIEKGDVVLKMLESAACNSLLSYSRGEELEVYVRARHRTDTGGRGSPRVH